MGLGYASDAASVNGDASASGSSGSNRVRICAADCNAAMGGDRHVVRSARCTVWWTPYRCGSARSTSESGRFLGLGYAVASGSSNASGSSGSSNANGSD